MSTGGQAIGGVLGAVGGFFVGGPKGALYGAQIGIAIGGYLDPPKGPVAHGPRLSDLSVQTATYGAFIPRGYGTFPVFGNVFWLENNKIKETVRRKKSSSGGKGGGSKTVTETYSYSATFAVGLLDCTDGTPIAGVRRIWLANRIYYDAGSSDLQTIIASNDAASSFTLYTGASSQAPDDRMQAALGVANTPAYRGLAYLVFKDLDLAAYNNSIAALNIKVEVVKTGSSPAAFSGPTSSPPIRALAGWPKQVFFDDRLWLIGGTQSGLNLETPSSVDGQNFIEYPTNFPGQNDAALLVFNDAIYCICAAGTREVWKTTDGTHWTLVTGDAGFTGAASRGYAAACVHDGKMWIFGGVDAAVTEYNDVWNSEDGINWTRVTANAGWHVRQSFGAVSYKGKLWIFNGITASGSANDVWNSDDGVTWTYVSTVAPPNTPPNIPSSDYSLVVFKDRVWMIGGGLSAGVYASTCISTDDGITFVKETISPSFPANRASACIGWGGTLFVHTSNNANMYHYIEPISSAAPTLGSIVQSECLLSKLLNAGDLDVSLLTQPVRGFRISSVSSIRSAIEPLQGAWPFDVVQSGYKIKFKPRGSASVATIEASELDARGVGDATGVSITNSIEMDSVLPRRVSLSFLDVDREYDEGQQYAERLNTESVNITAINLAIVLNSTEGAKIAETLLYLYWLERYDLRFSLPPPRGALEPGDVIVVNADEAAYALRLTAITYAANGILECTAKYDSAAIYTAAALGVAGESTGNALTPAGGSVFVFLDVPLLDEAFDLPGFPVGMAGYTPGWPGGVLYGSDDAGQTWSDIQGFAPPGAMIGRAINTIGAVSRALIDKASVLQVRFYGDGPSSVSELAMLGGANFFAYGSDGRWEIVAAQTCTLQGDGTYLLTDLLRARQGTEFAMSQHAVGDFVVALDDQLAFVSSNLSSIGAPKHYRDVTLGRPLESAVAEPHTYAGVNLKCLEPVFLNGNRHPTTNVWTLTWIRRTRIGGAWRDYVDASLGETSEAYEVDIFGDGSFATLKRTLSGLSSAAATYSSAQQVTDFGSNQATIYVKVYQLSSTTGRGYPLTTLITR